MIINTRKHVLERSYNSPIIHAVISWWHRGDLTWEQAMMSAVLELDERCEKLLTELESQRETIRE